METIQEDEELMTTEQSSQEEEKGEEDDLSYSADQEASFDKIQRAKVSRKKKKLDLAKIKKKTKTNSPPKWLCTVGGCKWGGWYRSLLETHIKTCHPNHKSSSRIQPYTAKAPSESWPPQLDVKKLDIALKNHQNQVEIDKLERKIKEL